MAEPSPSPGFDADAAAPIVLFDAGGANGADDGADVAAGLSAAPKTLPSRYFYDDRGSHLFERICELPEYYLTRAERALLVDSADAIARATGPSDLIELGSGSSTKTRLLLEAYLRVGPPVHYAPIDVSAGILAPSAERLAEAYGELDVRPIVGTYEAGLAALDEVLGPGAGGRPRLALFLGSTIGNFPQRATDDFLDRLRAALRPGDLLLVGMDLRKDPAVIEAAYNDADGVTAAFNLNILRHLNRRFDGDFALDGFSHLAVYDRRRHQIEMHLVSGRAQAVALKALGLEVAFAAGETVRTEISRKFDLSEFAGTLDRHGFDAVECWRDAEARTGLVLARAVGDRRGKLEAGATR